MLKEHQSHLAFPVDRFEWYAAHALILAADGDRKGAREHAIKALEAAKASHSGFRYHPEVGLVGSQYDALRDRLLVLSGASC